MALTQAAISNPFSVFFQPAEIPKLQKHQQSFITKFPSSGSYRRVDVDDTSSCGLQTLLVLQVVIQQQTLLTLRGLVVLVQHHHTWHGLLPSRQNGEPQAVKSTVRTSPAGDPCIITPQAALASEAYHHLHCRGWNFSSDRSDVTSRWSRTAPRPG